VIRSLYLFFTASALVYVTKFDSYGIYLFIATLWVIAGFIEDFQITAIWSIVIFMTGFAVMRMVNIATNGAPNSFYLSMFISEVVIILIGIKLLK
jgi:thiol:disulfide interchange protein